MHGSPARPFLVYLHGGPGAAELAVSAWFSRALSQHFCVWDQRGAGKSRASKVSVAQLTADCLELLGYLETHYHPSKLYLLGHSWGSFLGLLAPQTNPTRVDGLICVGPLV
jgi:pimeloyl-ACP methyl ester carboxylesterase